MEKIKLLEAAFLSTESMDETTRSHEKTMNWLMKMNILTTDRICKKCSNKMSLVKDYGRSDGCFYKCSYCSTKTNIRDGSFFNEHTKIPLIVICRIIFYYFAKGTSALETAKDLNKIFKDVKEGFISEKTVRLIFKEIRAKISAMYDTLASRRKLKGEGIEIDESLFSHITLKTKGKKARKQVWGVGLFERGSGDLRVFIVPDRTKETLNDLILRNVEVGATIITDDWGGYNELTGFGYKHLVLNKSKKGYGKGITVTSHIEGAWSELKAFASIYSKAIPPEQAQHFVQEFCFRRDCRRLNIDIVEQLAQIIA